MTDGLLRVTKYSLRSHWVGGLVLTLVLVLPPLGLQWIAFLREKSTAQLFMTSEFHFLFLAVSWIFFLALCTSVLDQMSRLIPRMPVSSAGLASGLMLSTLGIILMGSLIANGAYRLFLFNEFWFHEYWPVTGPTLFLATLTVVIHCGYWDLQAKGFVRLLLWSCFGLGMLVWFLSRYYPLGFQGPLVPWSEVTFPELLTMLSVFGLAWLLAIHSFDRVRCGAAVPSQFWEAMWTGLDSLKYFPFRTETRGLNSIPNALGRLYWRDACRIAVLPLMLAGLLVFVVHLTKGDTDANLIAFMFLAGSCFCLLFLLGFSLFSLKTNQFKGYLMIVPLSDQELSATLIKALLKLVLLVMASIVLFGLAGGGFISSIFEGTDANEESWSWLISYESITNKLYFAGLIFFAYWAIIANTVFLSWTPQRGTTESIFAIPVLSGIALFFSEIYPRFGEGFLVTISSLIWVITVLACLHAWRAGLISKRYLWGIVLFCLIVPWLYWDYWHANSMISKFFRSSLLVLTVTPFATIPLAVSWRRHR